MQMLQLTRRDLGQL
jgi:hypothetical protein